MTVILRSKTPLWVTFLSLVFLALAAACFERFGPSLVFNETPSEPQGLYRLVTHPGNEYRRGMYVVFTVPAGVRNIVYGRGWLRDRLPLLKELAGLSGDRVCITATEVALNGQRLGAILERDSQGFPLPQVRGCFVVRPGYFFALSRHHEKSFDGRYFGALPLAAVGAQAVPVWTF